LQHTHCPLPRVENRTLRAYVARAKVFSFRAQKNTMIGSDLWQQSTAAFYATIAI
jgi:hypothetical protein